jgi:hypothetical protein
MFALTTRLILRRSPADRLLAGAVAGLLALGWETGPLPAQVIPVPNGSFESPATTFVSININSWEKSPKPDWYVESGGFLWSQLTGLFKNTPRTAADHVDNLHGNQALWLFAVPEVAMFQDFYSMDWNDSVPTHEFDVRFQVGRSYHLTVGVIGGNGGMVEGATLDLRMFYRDPGGHRVTVARTTITNSPVVFSNTTHLLDFEVHVPRVRADDAWAGQNLGIEFCSTVSTNLQGGYWDLDNVRLFAGPALLDPAWADGQFQFTLRSEPGLRFGILTTTNAALPDSGWNQIGTFTNVTGTGRFTDPASGVNQRFYRAQELP